MVKNDFQLLPFYRSLDEQHHRKPYAFGNPCPLIFMRGLFPSFQLEFLHIEPSLIERYGSPIKSAGLYNLSGMFLADVTKELRDGINFSYTVGSPNDYFVYNTYNAGGMKHWVEGLAYMKLEFVSGEIFYSEVICFTKMASDYIRLQWYDGNRLEIDDKNSILYDKGYTNLAFIDAAIGKPSYDLDEEGEERDGYFFAEKQISKKTYKFSFVAPEYLCDILRLAGMSDYIMITYKGKDYVCDSILVDVDWEEQGDLASVNVEFTCDSIIKKIARAWSR